MIPRLVSEKILLFATQFRAVLIVGPRQSGKTTLIKHLFPSKPYVSLENPDERLLAETDPRGFLSRFPNGALLDEMQRVPLLLNYLQEILDTSKQDGLFVLTGSNNILFQESISQSLAGRVGVVDMLPLCFRELPDGASLSMNSFIRLGGYPEIHALHRKPELWYASYLRTFEERDVRQIKNIENAALFSKFLRLCAGRTGQLLNMQSLSVESGIDVRTATAWISVLVQTYIIRLLPAYHRSFNKRVVKSPKLYFVDTGLACYLLGIKTEQELSNSHFRGALAENAIVMDVFKQQLHLPVSNFELYYWRDNKGIEVDILLEGANRLIPVEVKSGQTFQPDYVRNLIKFNQFADNQEGALIYDGDLTFTDSNGIQVMNWKNALYNQVPFEK